MRVLLVDDRPETVKGIKDHCEEKGWESEIIEFDAFDEKIREFNPDVIVLDWMDDAVNQSKGNEIFEMIWSDGFRPVIIFSALASTISLDEKYKTSNLIKVQEKGDEEPVILYLEMMCPYTPVISNLKNDFNEALIEALNSISMMSKTGELSPDIMRYVFAKRVSTYFDKECGEAAPPPWIQYIYPPIAASLCVCDVIRSVPPIGDILSSGNPEEYYIILTPSCDMAQSKVSHVLCANCYPKEKFHGMELKDSPTESNIKRVKNYLNTGYNDSKISYPTIPEVLPYLSINLKMITTIPIAEIALQGNCVEDHHKYCRIASVDSPFREQIVWAHLINSCRPGMPNRNIDMWAKDILTV